MFLHQRCGQLVETLPALPHDPNRPEDAQTIGFLTIDLVPQRVELTH